MSTPRDAPGADGRFAPQAHPGPHHLGNLRTALLAWLFARSRARFLVRVEDLDRSRVRPGVEEAQLGDRRALGERPDEVLARKASSLGPAEIGERPTPPSCSRGSTAYRASRLA